MTTAQRTPAADVLDRRARLGDARVRVERRADQDVVVKRFANGGAGRVHAEHLMLWRSSFGALRATPGLPRPVAFDPDRQEVATALVDGVPLEVAGEPGQAWENTEDVAVLLADLHGCGVVVSLTCDDRALARQAVVLADALRHPAGVRRRSREQGAVAVLALRLGDALGRAADRSAPGGLVTSHGDFRPANVLATSEGLVAVSLDRVRMARPEHDLATWGASLWTAELVAGRLPSWFVLSGLVTSYTETTGGHARPHGRLLDHATLSWHQAAALLRLAHDEPVLADRPDLQAEVLGEGLRLLGQR